MSVAPPPEVLLLPNGPRVGNWLACARTTVLFAPSSGGRSAAAVGADPEPREAAPGPQASWAAAKHHSAASATALTINAGGLRHPISEGPPVPLCPGRDDC